jgi:hypothetical protein
MKENEILMFLMLLYVAAFSVEFFRHVLVDDGMKQYTDLNYRSCRDSLNYETSRADKAERGRSYYRRAALLGDR